MLDINIIRKRMASASAGLKKRNIENADELLNKLVALDDTRKRVQTILDEKLARMNALSKQIGELFKSGKRDEAENLRQESVDLKEEVNQLQDEQLSVLQNLEEELLQIPNIPHESVPSGKTPEDNEVVRRWGEFPVLASDNELPHWDLAKKFEIFDLELGVKLTGAGFPVYTGKGAQLQRGLINFFLSQATNAGYKEVIPPLLVNEASARATGQLPDKEGQMYEMKEDPYFLIPTAEVPITNMYRGELVEEKDLPIRLTGYTPCFRREAGSYGAHVRGLNRLHQFDKIEIVQIAHPDKSYEVLEEMVAHVESLVQALELPYRVLRLCGGDLGFTSTLTYDIEVYSAAQKRWLEVSSISNFETYQTNRLKLRYKDADGNRKLANTLNGSALALPRILAALIENNQEPDGIRMPKAIQPFVGFDKLN
jgi:seryl-tRNA synthetase|tara:strand:+ start:20257 stop:21534 length:1278 start_codon:yes stop_codon:yes gene_type:complete